MIEGPPFSASGEIRLLFGAATDAAADSAACELTVGPDGLTASDFGGTLVQWPAWEIGEVAREDYAITLTNALDESAIALSRFARRTDELETALRRARADALVRLMAPPGKTPMDLFEAAGASPGLLYRYDDALRWIPHTGNCEARLYAELSDAAFDPDDYALVLTGPYGETRITGLRRVTRELASETARRAEIAREQFAKALEGAGLPWGNEARSGRLRSHVAFEVTLDQLTFLQKTGIICDERREYWDVLVNESAIERVVLGSAEEGLRAVAICRVAGGELYEALSESDHASFVFEDATGVVRAFAEVGFRREPIFGGEEAERSAVTVLGRVLPSLRKAREGLRARVIHDEPGAWRRRLFG